MTIVADTSEAVIPSGTWTVDPGWSSVGFEVRKIGLATVKGRALEFSSTIFGGPEPTIEGTVSIPSITTFDDTRDAHIQSPDFFDAERYPELRFESTSVETRGEELLVDGQLTIKGVTKPVELRGRYVGAGQGLMGEERIALELEGTVDRTEFGLTWNAPLPGGGFLLPNDVHLVATFAATRAS